MNRHWKGGAARPRAAWSAILGLCGVCLLSNPALARQTVDSTTAERLVQQAQQAEVSGDMGRAFALLRQAVRVAPGYELARWHLGQVQIDGQWLAVEEAQRRTSTDPRQSEYRVLRQAHGESPEGQLALARWCRKNDLDDEARFHWASVLAVDPNHEEARRALGVRWQNGRLLTNEEIARQKDELRLAKRAAKHWAPAIARWRRNIAGHDAAQRDEALGEIRALATPDAIPAMETVTLGRDAADKKHAEQCHLIGLAFLESLAMMPDHAATESLVRHAVLAPKFEARASATDKLKPRPLHDFVPLLLSGLAMPIESSFSVTTDDDGSVHYRHTLYRAGPTADWLIDASHGSWQHFALEAADFVDDDPSVITAREINRRFLKARRMAQNTAVYQQQYAEAASAVEQQVARQNHQEMVLNDRIVPVLSQTTGQDFGASPREWWDWWQTYNEYYVPERPVYENHYVDFDHHYYPPPRQTSCFAKGTLVWTKTGQLPIEELALGDLVLSQNVDTGELTYKSVIGRTLRPPSPIVKLAFGDDSLRMTLGHPLWVAGVGWRMAKELGDGAMLHGISGSPRVASIAPDGEEEAYNLVVAEFNTYFVGESGILVHDNTPRRPTRAVIPGVSPSSR
jgi:hypothetical protein